MREQKKNRFIIYTYGENGRRVRAILSDVFDLDPVFIVDNELCKYNPKFIDAQRLKLEYKPGMSVLVCVESMYAVYAIKNELLAINEQIQK